jgi:phage gp37-like protein
MELENAVLAAIQAELGIQIKTLQNYQGDWQTDLSRQGWRFPAVLVRLRGSRARQVTAYSYDVTLDFQILVAVRQLRGESAGRLDAGGVYQLSAGIKKALWHRDLGLSISPFNLVREGSLLNTEEFTVYEAYYQTRFIEDL